jgi:predicted DNA-binding transcriptional regulator AlpA
MLVLNSRQTRITPAMVYDEDLWDVGEVARRLDVGQKSIWRWLAAGRFPQPLRLTRHTVRWRAADVRRFAEEHLAGRLPAVPEED